jgi:hypothetical protein
MRAYKAIPRFILSALFLLSFGLAPITSMAVNDSDLAPVIQQSNKWQVLIAPYGWLFGTDGTITARGTESTVDVTPMDLLRNLSAIDFIGQIHLELKRGPINLVFDPTYLKLTQSVRVGPIGADITPSMTIIDFGAYFTVLRKMASDHPYRGGIFQLFGGGRYFKIGAKIKPLRLPSVSGSTDFLAPVIGARLGLALNRALAFIAKADFGGFNVDCAKSTWGGALLGKYRFHKNWQVVAGYRWLSVNFSKGSGTSKGGMDATLYGPEAGIAVNF